MKNQKKVKNKKSKTARPGSQGHPTKDDMNDDLSRDETAVNTTAASSLDSECSLKGQVRDIDGGNTFNPVEFHGNRKVASLHGIDVSSHQTSPRNLHRSRKLLPPQYKDTKSISLDYEIEANRRISSLNGFGHVHNQPNVSTENGVHGDQRVTSNRLTMTTKENNSHTIIAATDVMKNSKRKRKREEEVTAAEKLDPIEAPVFTYSGEQDESDVLGEDGNLFNCHICNDVGDVVCCDGCPHVYHVQCIPMHCESRLSLDRNDDPWYCPDCFGKSQVNNLKENEADVIFDKYRRSPRLKKEQNISYFGKNGNSGDSSVPQKAYSLKGGKGKDDSDEASDQMSFDDEHDDYLKQLKSSPLSPITSIKATSPFHLYIIQNRVAIERHLFKRNQDFKRSKKGPARNFLIAKEAAKRWRRANILERKKYIDSSMQEFERKIISWKEDLVIREMMGLQESSKFTNVVIENKENEEENLDSINVSLKSLERDSKYWENRLKRLHGLSRLESFPVSTSATQNLVLMQLLKDQRFQPIKLISPSRTEAYFNEDEENLGSMQHIAIQGPASANLGDVCAGCTRGWNHFCPILKTVIPAVDIRAKMQPPVNTLMLTRIGFGQFIQSPTIYDHGNTDSDHFEHNSTSFLDGAEFKYDETTTFLDMVSSVTKDHRYYSENPGGRKAYMCLTCKNIIESPYGCLTCRKTKVLKVMSRVGTGTVGFNEPNTGSNDRWSVQAKMLNHMDWKLNSFKHQLYGQAAFADATMAKLWKPNAVMPYFQPEAIAKLWKANAFTSDHQSATISPIIAPHKLSSEISVDEYEVPSGLRASNRLKGTQNKADGANTLALKPEDCQLLAVEHRDEAVSLQRQCLSVAILGILCGLLRRDPMGLFAKQVPDTVESYRAIVSDPIDFSIIRSKALEGKYSSLGAFIADVRRLCENALAYNLPGTIYSITANELYDSIDEMQGRANTWMNAIRIAHAAHFNRRGRQNNVGANEGYKIVLDNQSITFDESLITKLRESRPGAVEILENSEWLRSFISSNIFRTKENECALYGSIAIGRVAKASESCRSVTAYLNDLYNPCILRSHIEDEELRSRVDHSVGTVIDFPSLMDVTTWNENQVLRILKRVQEHRLEDLSASTSGCARCDELEYDDEGLPIKSFNRSQNKKNIADLSVGGISRSCTRVNVYPSCGNRNNCSSDDTGTDLGDVCNDDDKYKLVSVRGSLIHGWGLFADVCFKKGEVVAEYIGEWIGNAVADAREIRYKRLRIQDYQFRVSSELVIDATMKGGFARYINHSCEPNCVATIISGSHPYEELKRVLIISQREIEPSEEITYDYQFPLELDSDKRIPCTCGAKLCRGFMNWENPEQSTFTAKNIPV